ncbi:MAG TPA: Uma2 family endonuclease [Thermomonospora sp.]|nr:Uma2 family endonuclease [Thermomonospora sp.]
MSVVAATEYPVILPDTPHAMWERDVLRDYLHIPHDRTRVEIVGGKIVVSPGPRFGHDRIVRDINKAFTAAQLGAPDFAWDCPLMVDLNLVEITEGYVPDLMVMRSEVLKALDENDDRHAHPDHVEMVVEVTSASNARNDREPTDRRTGTKWTGYARVEIPYYLLVDRDPKAPLITLYSIPDQATGAYLHRDTWAFGETVVLEHFGVEIDTSDWKPWSR